MDAIFFCRLQSAAWLAYWYPTHPTMRGAMQLAEPPLGLPVLDLYLLVEAVVADLAVFRLWRVRQAVRVELAPALPGSRWRPRSRLAGVEPGWIRAVAHMPCGLPLAAAAVRVEDVADLPDLEAVVAVLGEVADGANRQFRRYEAARGVGRLG